MDIITDMEMSLDDINELEDRRVEQLNKAGIDEGSVLDSAKENIETWNSFFNENIVRGKDDMNFCLRDQWTAVERSEFTRLFKPAMTFNKIYPEIKKTVGEQRKNKPDLIVRSLTGKSTQQQIDLRADLVRTISYQSQNDLVYQTAFKSALTMGFGAFQVCIDYENPRSFNKIIKFDMITDAIRTFFDPKAVKPHKGDGDFCARNYTFGRKEFDATYPYITNPVSYSDPFTLLDFEIQSRDTIVICDYFVKEWFPLTIHQLSNGQVVTDKEWDNLQKLFKEQKELVKGSIVGGIIMKEMPRIISTRQTQDYYIMHYRLLQNQIIDFMRWPSKCLPIIFVDGDSYFIQGQQYSRSFIHEARDAQKCVNYFGSEIAAEVKNRRREQWLATPDNIIGYEQQWRNPELQMGALMAKPDPKTGQMPIKQPPWDLSPALMQNFQRATMDIREILGVSENDQLQGKDISGTARRERKLESSMSAYVYFDNLNQAIEQAGRVVLDLLPYIYGNDERNVNISKKDGSSQTITLNKKTSDGDMENQMTAGDYDIEIDTGPSFAVQKEVALEFLQGIIQASPQIFPLIGDLYASNLDVQFMPQIKERLQTLVPPEILAKEAGEPPPPPQPNPQQQMMQMEMQEKQQRLQLDAQKIANDQQKLDIEKAKLMMDAQKVQQENQLNLVDHQLDLHKATIVHDLDHKKTDLDFTAKIANILADVHKHEGKMENDRQIAKNKKGND